MTGLLYADDYITELIRRYVKKFFPEMYEILRPTFKRGNWVGKEVDGESIGDGGLFLGRVTLWKLQTGLHLDVSDSFCVMFCQGDFHGGWGCHCSILGTHLPIELRSDENVELYAANKLCSVSDDLLKRGETLNRSLPRLCHPQRT